MDNANYDGDWREYRRLVIDKFDDLTARLDAANIKLEQLTIDMAIIKLKSGLWGAGIALLVSLAAAFLKYATGH